MSFIYLFYLRCKTYVYALIKAFITFIKAKRLDQSPKKSGLEYPVYRLTVVEQFEGCRGKCSKKNNVLRVRGGTP